MENQGQSFAYLYHQALINPKDVSLDDFDLLLSKYPYSQPLHFALERRKFLRGELNKLGNRAILLASSPNWLYEYVQLPVKDVPYTDVVDNDYVPYDDADQQVVEHTAVPEVSETAELQHDQSAPQVDHEVLRTEALVAEPETTGEGVSAVNSEDVEQTSTAQRLVATDDENTTASASDEELTSADSVVAETGLETATASNDAVVSEESTVSETDVADDQASESVGESLHANAESQEEKAASETADEDTEELETLVQEGIGGGDYFALHAKGIRWETEPDSTNVAIEEQPEEENEEDEVSLYNDELMPYSFRWWLHKTRLEYADTYQPFASAYLPVNKKSAFDPVSFDKIVLDQQIRENIIHLQRPEDKLSDEVKQRAVTYTRVDKTSQVIEKFIREEPQIQPPPADQLNMENKARKSSEEQFDLVTETLATIYASQAMYVKAIEVYKKLILKYPEKKSYFANQIKELEEKLY